MEVAVSGKHLDLTDALEHHVRDRLRKLDRYFPGQAPVAHAVLSVQRNRQTAEVTASAGNLLLHAEESALDMYAAVDLVVHKLERQIHKHKTRIYRKQRHEPVTAHADVPESLDADRLLRSTRPFPLKPMAVEEAILQMYVLGHEFFAFRDAGTGQLRILYRRKQGGYGLLAAE